MRYFLPSLTIILLVSTLSGYSQTKVYIDNLEERVKIFSENKLPFHHEGIPFTGIGYDKHPNGTVLIEMTLSEGIQHGPIHYYYEDGQLQGTGTYKSGERDGLFEEYYENGQLRTVQTFINGERNGVSVEYYEWGIVKKRGTYINGEKDGQWIDYYDGGDVRSVVSYKNGKMDGLFEIYQPDGQLSWKRTFKDGEKVSPDEEYDKDGEIITKDKNVNVEFGRSNNPLNITIEGEGTVEEQIISSPKGTEYTYETAVKLTPKPSKGWRFESWGGDLSGYEVPKTVTITGDNNVTLKFDSKIKTFGGSMVEEGESIIQTTDGGYVLTGSTRSNDGDFSGMNQGSWDIFVMKLSQNGKVQWNKTFGGSESESGRSIIQTTDGGYVLTGSTRSNDGDFSGINNDHSNIFVMKLSQNGEIQWNKTFGGGWGDSIIQSTDGGYVLTGSSAGIFVMKLYQNGEIQWNKTFGGSGSESGRSIIQTTDGAYVLTGYTSSNDGDFSGMNKGSSDIFVMNLSQNGEIQWNKTFGGSMGEDGSSIVQTTDGGYVLTGTTRSNDGDFSGMHKYSHFSFVMKLSQNGEIQWNKPINESFRVSGNSIIQTTDGGYVLTGSSDSNSNFPEIAQILVMKFSQNGEIQWNKTFGGSGGDWGNSIIQTTNGGYVLTGITHSNNGDFSGLNKGTSGIFVIFLDGNGNLKYPNEQF